MGTPVAFLAYRDGEGTTVTEMYVIGSIILSMIVVGLLFFGPKHHSWIDDVNAAFRCPRCGAMMEDVGSGVSGVVQRILVYKCPQCGYFERSWSC
jgi:hypothetical protein